MHKATKLLPDQSYLRECFSYDPATGLLRWLDRPASHFASPHAYRGWTNRIGRLSDRTAGSLHHLGYINVQLDKKLYPAHRIIFKLMTGRDADTVDHKDGIGSNNVWDNLRDGTTLDNTRNRKVREGT